MTILKYKITLSIETSEKTIFYNTEITTKSQLAEEAIREIGRQLLLQIDSVYEPQTFYRIVTDEEMTKYLDKSFSIPQYQCPEERTLCRD